MIGMPVWQSLLFMLPVVFATALVSSFMRSQEFRTALRETLRLTILIVLGIAGLSAISFAIHYLFAGGVVWL
jgi:hypothetical protein